METEWLQKLQWAWKFRLALRADYFYLSGGTVFLVEHNAHYTLKVFGASPSLFSSLILALMLSTSTRTLY